MHHWLLREYKLRRLTSMAHLLKLLQPVLPLRPEPADLLPRGGGGQVLLDPEPIGGVIRQSVESGRLAGGVAI